MTMSRTTLLMTKLFRPSLRHEHIPRQRLFERLDGGLTSPFTLVCAGAGFGKTSLVSDWLEWLETRSTGPAAIRSAWLSLDEHDSELQVFVRYLIAAIRSVLPDAMESSENLQNHRVEPPLSEIYVTLANDLANLPEPILLVLDDYHLIHDADIHNLWNSLLRHWPEPLRLVLISRHSPPLPLVQLRASGRIVEIRNRDLRFSFDELAEYLNKVLAYPLDDNELKALEERTEGWLVGVQLASLWLRGGQTIRELMSALSGTGSEITDYLTGEVLFLQAPHVQHFLLESSILDPFCAELCDAVLSTESTDHSAAEVIQSIVRENLFVRSLDAAGKWFHFHPLFRELLQRRLVADFGREHVDGLCRAASNWFAAEGMPQKAIDYALAGGDVVGAARVMETELGNLLNREDRQGMERWLRMLPPDLVESRPGLLMIKVWVTNFRWQLQDVARYTQQAEAMLHGEAGKSLSQAERQVIEGQIAMSNCQYAYARGQPASAIELAKKAYSLLPSSWTYLRGAAMFWYAFSMLACGQGQTAEDELLALYETLPEKGDGLALRVLMAIGFINLQTGNPDRAEQTAKLMIRNSTRTQLDVIVAWAHYILGVAYYYQDRLTLAEAHFKEATALRYQAHSLCARQSAAGLVSVHLATGNHAEAQAISELLIEYDMAEKGVIDDITQSMHARFLAATGNLGEAHRWAATFDKPVHPFLLVLFELPQLTQARLLIAHESEAHHLQGRQILRELCGLAEGSSNTRLHVELLATSALAFGERIDSHVTVLRAIKLAQSRGLIRPFIDLGMPMYDLLTSLPPSATYNAFVEQILAHGPPRTEPERALRTVVTSTQNGDSLIEPLTTRETQIVRLMREPLSTKEIAHQLNISYATAKRHSINIYGKLGVSSRWDAVAKAEAIGILPTR